MKPRINPAPFWRRLASMFYDCLILVALWMFAVLVALLLLQTGNAPLGEAVPSRGIGHYFFQLYLLAVAFAFLGWFWAHGGQTAGMRAWGLHLVRADGQPAGWREAALRFGTALLSWLPLGLGFWWALFDPQNRAWHDRLSGTRLEYRPRRGTAPVSAQGRDI